MQHWVKCSVLGSVMLSGCSLVQSTNEQVVEQRRIETIQVPESLERPGQPGEFDIPVTNATAAATDTRSPTLVLASAASSRVEEGERASRVWFDRNDITGDLVPFLQRMLQTQFSEQGVELTAQDEQGLIYHTGWINRSAETGFWFWSAPQQTEQARFKIEIAPRTHGR